MFRLIKTNPNMLKPCGYNLFIVAKGFATRDEAIKARLEFRKNKKFEASKSKRGWNVHIQEYIPRAKKRIS